MLLGIKDSGFVHEIPDYNRLSVKQQIMEELGTTSEDDLLYFVPRYITRAMNIPNIGMYGLRGVPEDPSRANHIASVLWANENKLVYGPVVIASCTEDGIKPLELMENSRILDTVFMLQTCTKTIDFSM